MFSNCNIPLTNMTINYSFIHSFKGLLAATTAISFVVKWNIQKIPILTIEYLYVLKLNITLTNMTNYSFIHSFKGLLAATTGSIVEARRGGRS